jgi:hypothetical protein
MARPRGGSEEDNQEFEFSMIDQADFSGIDTYIKRHGLQDASLADARRAKVYNVNKPTGEEQTTTEVAGEDESELQKAQRELEDQEDEEEEDYDPGSDDSEGSGSSSEEDEDQDEEEAQGSDEDMDVKDEPGSEDEDVNDE